MSGDARTANWRFVVPDEPPGMVVLPTQRSEAEPLAGVGPFPAVAVPDLTGWSLDGRRATAGLLGDLCRSVAPGGWLCLGFANALYPGAPRRGALRLAAVRRVLRRSGLDPAEVYLGLPGHRGPALLVPAGRRAELDYVLQRLFLTYTPPDSAAPRLRRRLLAAARGVAVVVPHPLRAALAPGYVVVARRPT
jgi:hypothetical protein